MPLSKDDIEKYMTELGKFTTGFATLEFGLGAWVSVISSFYEYPGMPNTPGDSQFARKVDYVREAYNHHPDLSAHLPNATAWLDGINDLKTDRAYLLKGIISIRESTGQKFLLNAMKINGRETAVPQKPISMERLINMRKDAFKIGTAMISHAKAIYPKT